VSRITSYLDLPKDFFQVATKFRNEIRPRVGLMRAKEEFVMMDAIRSTRRPAASRDTRR